jgi:hypothetical protein
MTGLWVSPRVAKISAIDGTGKSGTLAETRKARTMKRRVPIAWNGGSRERALELAHERVDVMVAQGADGNGGTSHTLCPQCRVLAGFEAKPAADERKTGHHLIATFARDFLLDSRWILVGLSTAIHSAQVIRLG